MDKKLIKLCLKRIDLLKKEGRIATQRRLIEREIVLHHMSKLRKD